MKNFKTNWALIDSFKSSKKQMDIEESEKNFQRKSRKKSNLLSKHSVDKKN